MEHVFARGSSFDKCPCAVCLTSDNLIHQDKHSSDWFASHICYLFHLEHFQFQVNPCFLACFCWSLCLLTLCLLIPMLANPHACLSLCLLVSLFHLSLIHVFSIYFYSICSYFICLSIIPYSYSVSVMLIHALMILDSYASFMFIYALFILGLAWSHGPSSSFLYLCKNKKYAGRANTIHATHTHQSNNNLIPRIVTIR